MYAKVLAYAGEHRRYTAMAIACMLVGLTANTLQYIFAYQLIRPLLVNEAMSWGFIGARLACIAVCAVAHALLYVQGLSFSHEGAYNTLKNIRVALQGKLEKQPLGTIQDMGVGSVKRRLSTISTALSCCSLTRCRRAFPMLRFRWSYTYSCSLSIGSWRFCRWAPCRSVFCRWA